MKFSMLTDFVPYWSEDLIEFSIMFNFKSI